MPKNPSTLAIIWTCDPDDIQVGRYTAGPERTPDVSGASGCLPAPGRAHGRAGRPGRDPTHGAPGGDRHGTNGGTYVGAMLTAIFGILAAGEYVVSEDETTSATTAEVPDGQVAELLLS